MNNSTKHVGFLDQFRGVAILAVLLCHALGTVYGNDFVPWNGWFRDFSQTPLSSICLFPLSFGQAGVAIFFVVSGFCIHMSFQQQGQNWGSFYLRRFFRLYPAYLAATIFMALLLATNHIRAIFEQPDIWKQLAAHVFLVHNVAASTYGTINGAFWSLAIEAQLYLLYPALLVLVAKLGWHRSMIILAGGELLIQGTNGTVDMMGWAGTVGGNISGLLYRSPLAYWFSWALGAYIADAHIKGQPLPFLRNSPVWWLALSTATYLFKPLKPFWFILIAMATAVAISQMLNGAYSKIKAPGVLSNFLKNTGLWSYSIYLLHMPLIVMYYNAIIPVIPQEHRSNPLNLMVAVATLLVIIPFSILWYKAFELPGIDLGKRIIQKRFTALQCKTVPESFQVLHMKWRHGVTIGTLMVFIFCSFMAIAKFTPLSPEEGNNLAWQLATSPDDKIRNGTRAVELAKDACEQTQYKKTIMVGTLAAAYAEAGRFDDAISTAQRACLLAAENGETNLLESNQKFLKLYEDHRPYHEPPANP